MSRLGAMVDYVFSKVDGVFPEIKKTILDRSIDDIPVDELPICIISEQVPQMELLDFRQRDQSAPMLVTVVMKFSTGDLIRQAWDKAELIEEAIWDGNASDTDAAGFFAYVTQWNHEMSGTHADRIVILMNVVFDTTDAVDSAFSLVEDSI